MKKSTLELGGNDVFVVTEDADLDEAVRQGVQARLSNCGQVCTAAKRFILNEKIADTFIDKFSAALNAAVLGDPLDEKLLWDRFRRLMRAIVWLNRLMKPSQTALSWSQVVKRWRA